MTKKLMQKTFRFDDEEPKNRNLMKKLALGLSGLVVAGSLFYGGIKYGSYQEKPKQQNVFKQTYEVKGNTEERENKFRLEDLSFLDYSSEIVDSKIKDMHPKKLKNLEIAVQSLDRVDSEALKRFNEDYDLEIKNRNSNRYIQDRVGKIRANDFLDNSAVENIIRSLYDNNLSFNINLANPNPVEKMVIVKLESHFQARSQGIFGNDQNFRNVYGFIPGSDFPFWISYVEISSDKNKISPLYQEIVKVIRKNSDFSSFPGDLNSLGNHYNPENLESIKEFIYKTTIPRLADLKPLQLKVMSHRGLLDNERQKRIDRINYHSDFSKIFTKEKIYDECVSLNSMGIVDAVNLFNALTDPNVIKAIQGINNLDFSTSLKEAIDENVARSIDGKVYHPPKK